MAPGETQLHGRENSESLPPLGVAHVRVIELPNNPLHSTLMPFQVFAYCPLVAQCTFSRAVLPSRSLVVHKFNTGPQTQREERSTRTLQLSASNPPCKPGTIHRGRKRSSLRGSLRRPWPRSGWRRRCT